jgi:hypothetical protein
MITDYQTQTHLLAFQITKRKIIWDTIIDNLQQQDY